MAAPGAKEPGAILVLERDGGSDEQALLEALRIYTRDLGCGVIAATGAPLANTPSALAAAVSAVRATREGNGLAVPQPFRWDRDGA